MPKNIVLEFNGVHQWFKKTNVLHDVCLQITKGSIVALVGESGCGKTTLVSAGIGEVPPKQGSVHLHFPYSEQESMQIKQHVSQIGIVYQETLLLPHLTALQNVAIGLKWHYSTMPSRNIHSRKEWENMEREHLEESEALLEQFGVADVMHHLPQQLSGGQARRIAIAASLIMKPEVLVLDEPFANVDWMTKETLHNLFLTYYQENCKAKEQGEAPQYTFIIITHDVKEAIKMSDRIVGLSPYWNWKDNNNKSCPGSTIIYDNTAPIIHPNETTEEHQVLRGLEDEIKGVVYNKKYRGDPKDHQVFWDKVNSGQGEGVMKQ